MGIHGLSYFIKSLPTIVDNVKWEIAPVEPIENHRDHFIIDGNAFVYHIAFENRTNWTHGGQYANIAGIIVKTVDSLNKAGIRLTFLFDGALPQDKLETRVKRHKSYIERCASTYWNLKQINSSNKNADERQNGIQYYGDLFLIPPLTLEVIIQTLKELDVDVKVCEAEADGEVVNMAARENAYVVSQDSDMHVYPNIGKGYIPFELLKIPINDEEEDNEYISAGVYHPEALAKSLNLEPFQLPLFGTLLGNDYLDADLVRFPIGHWCSIEGIHVTKNNQSGWPKVVAEFIRRNSQSQGGKNCIIPSVANQLKPIIAKSSMKSREEKANGFEDRIINSISRYDANSPLLKKSSELKNDNNTSETCIDNISKQFINTKSLSRQIMDVISSKTFWTSIFIEDIEREYSWDVSRSLRQGLYGTVSEKLGEQDQQDKETKKNEIIIQEHVREKQHLEVIQVIGGVIQNQRSTTIYDFYRFHVSNQNHIKDHNPILHPLILSIRYMIYHCSQSIENGRLFNYEVIGIIISTLRSLAPTLGYTHEEVPLPNIGIPALKKRSIHLAAQYQSIIYSSFLLSQILDIADYLQLPHVLSHMYNGIYFHYYIEIARGGASISRMLHNVTPEFKTLFCSVYKSIMTDLYDEVQDVFDYDIITSAIEEWTISDNKPKRLISLNSNNQPDKKKKKKSQSISSNSNSNNNGRSTNAFNVLSFGCNFDE